MRVYVALLAALTKCYASFLKLSAVVSSHTPLVARTQINCLHDSLPFAATRLSLPSVIWKRTKCGCKFFFFCNGEAIECVLSLAGIL